MNSKKEFKAGQYFKGVVKKVFVFGAFIEIVPGTEGLLHINNMLPEFVVKENGMPNGHTMGEGQEVGVFIEKIENVDQIRLSQKPQ